MYQRRELIQLMLCGEGVATLPARRRRAFGSIPSATELVQRPVSVTLCRRLEVGNRVIDETHPSVRTRRR